MWPTLLSARNLVRAVEQGAHWGVNPMCMTYTDVERVSGCLDSAVKPAVYCLLHELAAVDAAKVLPDVMSNLKARARPMVLLPHSTAPRSPKPQTEREYCSKIGLEYWLDHSVGNWQPTFLHVGQRFPGLAESR